MNKSTTCQLSNVMRRSRIWLFIIITIVALACTSNPKTENDDHNRDFQVREGLPNAVSKLERGDTLRIGYLGGSITAQPGWRIYSQEWLGDNYSESEIIEIHAAIGGTGSDFGVFRLQEHVLQFEPDLLFVEFAVNDGSAEPKRIIQSMEGIVRQTWEQYPETDICFVYTISEPFTTKIRQGVRPRSIETMEHVAEYYQIPSISFGPEVVRRVGSGDLIFKAKKTDADTVPIFSPDGVHPYPDSGHKIYHDVFKRAFSEIGSNIASPKQHLLSGPIDSTYFSNTDMYSWGNLPRTMRFEKIEVGQDDRFKSFAKYFDSVGKIAPGEELAITFNGTAFGFYDIRGPGVGQVGVSLDGVPYDTISRFDKHCTYWRISYKLITDLTDERHEVVFSVLEDPIDKVAILAERGSKMKDPDDYEGLDWYLAKILVNGNIVHNEQSNSDEDD